MVEDHRGPTPEARKLAARTGQPPCTKRVTRPSWDGGGPGTGGRGAGQHGWGASRFPELKGLKQGWGWTFGLTELTREETWGV